MKKILILTLISLLSTLVSAQDNLISNTGSRKSLSLNGKWQYIVDPYETGFYDYRYKELKETNKDAYWNTDVQANKTEKKEHGYADKYSLEVPGDWNHQQPEFLYYEGTVWYKKSFDIEKGNAVCLTKTIIRHGMICLRSTSLPETCAPQQNGATRRL